MRILILTASDPYKTAGIVALDLYNSLSTIKGNQVKVLVKHCSKISDINIVSLENKFAHYKNRLFRKVKGLYAKLKIVKHPHIKLNRDFSVEDYDQTITYYTSKSIQKRFDFEPDIIIILFMQKFLSFKNLYELSKITKTPIFLYMMDMAPMTGCCHYAWECKGYENQCGKCPALFSDNMLDQSHINWNFKKEYVEKTNVTVIAGSEWTFQQLLKSRIFKNKHKHKILLPINEETFIPIDKQSIRKQLGLPLNKKIIFFGAVNTNNKRKGFLELIESFRVLNNITNESLNIHLAIAGYSNIDLEKNLPYDYTLLGYLNHDNLIKALQAADVFVSPSIEDSGPMMVNQSLMCGIPVVAFEMGVALDLVHTGETGYRAILKDSTDLAIGIKSILELDDQEYKKMSANCRETGLRLCHPESKGKEWMDLITK